jgi:hypothetical protein
MSYSSQRTALERRRQLAARLNREVGERQRERDLFVLSQPSTEERAETLQYLKAGADTAAETLRKRAANEDRAEAKRLRLDDITYLSDMYQRRVQLQGAALTAESTRRFNEEKRKRRAKADAEARVRGVAIERLTLVARQLGDALGQYRDSIPDSSLDRAVYESVLPLVEEFDRHRRQQQRDVAVPRQEPIEQEDVPPPEEPIEQEVLPSQGSGVAAPQRYDDSKIIYGSQPDDIDPDDYSDFERARGFRAAYAAKLDEQTYVVGGIDTSNRPWRVKFGVPTVDSPDRPLETPLFLVEPEYTSVEESAVRKVAGEYIVEKFRGADAVALMGDEDERRNYSELRASEVRQKKDADDAQRSVDRARPANRARLEKALETARELLRTTQEGMRIIADNVVSRAIL